MGFFEKEEFSYGTKEIWKSILENKEAKIIIGGGETIASYKLIESDYPLNENVFISTGGGAMLYYLANKKLPGIENLKK
jgi:phosphoglycerate kinase